MRLAHVALWTSDLDRACAFWAEVFGAAAGSLYAIARRPGFVSRFVSLVDGPQIELMTGPWVKPKGDQEERVGWAHVAISVGSEEAVRRLADRTSDLGALVSAPRWTGDGFYEAVIQDPDGNLIEITS